MLPCQNKGKDPIKKTEHRKLFYESKWEIIKSQIGSWWQKGTRDRLENNLGDSFDGGKVGTTGKWVMVSAWMIISDINFGWGRGSGIRGRRRSSVLSMLCLDYLWNIPETRISRHLAPEIRKFRGGISVGPTPGSHSNSMMAGVKRINNTISTCISYFNLVLFHYYCLFLSWKKLV